MPKLKLTEKKCAAAKYDKPAGSRTPVWLWDTGRPGLALRIEAGGAKTWYVRYSVGRTSKFLKLAKYGALPEPEVAEARKLAAKRLGEVANDRDPVAERRAKRQAKTVADVCTAFAERHLPKLRSQRTPKRVLAGLRERWGKKPATSITRADVAQLHHEITARGAELEANRWVQFIKALWNHAEEWGLVPDGHLNPARRVSFNDEKSRRRDRWVTHEELPQLFAAIEAHDDVFMRGVLLLALFTGCRKGELLEAKWEHVDLARRELRIPHPKQGKPHIVPLSGPAMEVIESLPRFDDNEHVFPGRHGRGHLVNVDKVWRAIRDDAGLKDVRFHDLRRTVGSWLAVGGASLVLIGKALGHSQPSTTQIYARLHEDPVRAALEQHGAELMKVARAKPKAAAKVVRMPTRQARKRA